MDYLVWDAGHAGNACTLLEIENVEYDHQLSEGISRRQGFPEDALLRMSPHFKKDTKLVDDVKNASRIKVCSKRLVEFLKSKTLHSVEFLPITILNHKNKVASKDYSIVNPIGLQDAIDMKKSVPTLNPIDGKIDEVKQLVFDKSRIDPKVRVFRFAGLTRPVMIEATLAKELEEQGFVGLDFLDPEQVTG